MDGLCYLGCTRSEDSIQHSVACPNFSRISNARSLISSLRYGGWTLKSKRISEYFTLMDGFSSACVLNGISFYRVLGFRQVVVFRTMQCYFLLPGIWMIQLFSAISLWEGSTCRDRGGESHSRFEGVRLPS